MIEINGKKYEINTDTRLKTEKYMSMIMAKPDNPKNIDYMGHVLKDLLIPTPSTKELGEFRRSDREKVFEMFSEEMGKTDKDLKKKLSLL